MSENRKREMIRDINGHIKYCIEQIAAAMKDYGYFYDVPVDEVKECYKNYTEVYKEIPIQAKTVLEDALYLGYGSARAIEKSFVHYKKICSQFDYPNDRVLDRKID